MLKINSFFSAALLALTLNAPITQAKTLNVVIDQSSFTEHLKDPNFNAQVREFVTKEVEQLKRGDDVRLMYFGSLNAPENFKQGSITLSRHNKRKVAHAVNRQIANLTDTAHAQASTNLLAFLGRNKFGCELGSKILIITDGIEVSEYVDPLKLLSGKSSLPKPHEFVRLDGCEVVFFGLGLGMPDTQALNLRRAWQAYFSAANASFDVE